MLDSERIQNGFKLFFVDGLYADSSFSNRVGGICVNTLGIAIDKQANEITLPHETIHNYLEIKDIYLVANDNNGVAVGETLLSREHLPKDWGAGFYPKDLPLTNIINRLLMNGSGDGGKVIPRGKVYGVFYDKQGINPQYKLDLVPVGLEHCPGPIPKHR